METTEQLLVIIQNRARQHRKIQSSAKRLRLQAGVTLREAAAICGVSRTAIAAWETGAYRPVGPHLDAYVAFLDVLGGEE